ncbi:hypothetical protein FRACYDRAFT_246551 [Fragilariopsis cylindrus CCMP1102]|uniref:Uncharacterized protein n=1 Tax=Fragilariopsis cylindrus CCMP1102 TaxID=635003 RepID=A0A1E7EXH7_9STRA|nr:hypothetical protein FRACYDRAFT_246551 [Fragilariopsis cylindrus CCMP1102]|eukprot:OEU10740.1 hypothetical protein FRACYDRAFT_246551 [Fragilariopsis cylindrus CCMP1102]
MENKDNMKKIKDDASTPTVDDVAVAVASHHTSASMPPSATAASFIPPSTITSILKTTTTNNDNSNNNDSGQSSPSRQRRRRKQQQAPMSNGSGISIDSASRSIGHRGGGGGKRRNKKDTGKSYFSIPYFVALIVILMITIQLILNTTLHNNRIDTTSDNNNNGKLRKGSGNTINDILLQDHHDQLTIVKNSYDVLLKNTINYNISSASQYNNIRDQSNVNNRNDKISSNDLLLQQQMDNMRSEISNLESKSMKYVDDSRFFPFVIRDSRHLTPTQINHDFHIFDYVDLTQAKQPKSKHSQLFHNARLVVDDILENYRSNLTGSQKKKAVSAVEPNEAPCQYYSVKCYRQKILQVFSYVLRKFPNVEYYFYIEADNDLCVPMTMVKDLALTEKRYFINTGIGFSGWIMSRSFLTDFIRLYGNTTLDGPVTKIINSTTKIGETEIIKEEPEIRPDVLASYYLTDRQAWAVTRQYWVSHTTLESLGIASLTVKDRRKDSTGERMKLDKHLPRCLEPRRGKWKVSRRKPFLDPRDRFGWDYFDYDVCPNELLFPCGGPDQLKKSIAEDWRIANETGALAKWKRVEEVKKKKEEEKLKKAAVDAKATEKKKEEEKLKKVAVDAKATKKAAADAAKVKASEESKKKKISMMIESLKK